MKEACVIIEDDAKDAIGTYRYGWPPLGPAAVAKHGDTPLLDTGAMRDSIKHTVESAHVGYVGTNSEYAKYQELGTSKIPPRPFLVELFMRSTMKLLNVLVTQLKRR